MTGQVPEDTRSHAQQWVQFSRTWAVMGWIPKDTRSHAQSRMAVSLVLEDVGGHPRVWARSPRTGAVTHRGELGSREQARLQLPGGAASPCQNQALWPCHRKSKGLSGSSATYE